MLFDSILARTDEDGQPFYSAEELEHFLPMILLSALQTSDPAQWPEELVLALDRGLERANAKHLGGKEAVLALLEYYEKNPVDPTLFAEFMQASQTETLEAVELPSIREFAKGVAGRTAGGTSSKLTGGLGAPTAAVNPRKKP